MILIAHQPLVSQHCSEAEVTSNEFSFDGNKSIINSVRSYADTKNHLFLILTDLSFSPPHFTKHFLSTIATFTVLSVLSHNF